MKNVIKIALPIIPLIVVFILVFALGRNATPSIDIVSDNDHIIYLNEKISQDAEKGNFEAYSNHFYDIVNKIQLAHKSGFITDDECNILMKDLANSYIPTWSEFAKKEFDGTDLWNDYFVSVILRDCDLLRPYLTSESGDNYTTFCNIDNATHCYDRILDFTRTMNVNSMAEMQDLVDVLGKYNNVEYVSDCKDLITPIAGNMKTLGRVNYNLLIDYVNKMQPGMSGLSQQIDSARIFISEYKTNAQKLYGEMINVDAIENRLSVLTQGGTQRLAALPHTRVSSVAAPVTTASREKDTKVTTPVRARKHKTNILGTDGLFE